MFLLLCLNLLGRSCCLNLNHNHPGKVHFLLLQCCLLWPSLTGWHQTALWDEQRWRMCSRGLGCLDKIILPHTAVCCHTYIFLLKIFIRVWCWYDSLFLFHYIYSRSTAERAVMICNIFSAMIIMLSHHTDHTIFSDQLQCASMLI